MTELQKFEYLGVALPESVLSYKYYGDFDGEIRAIDAYLERPDIPAALRTRLEVERIIANGMKREYSVKPEDAFCELSARFSNFSEEQMQRMMDSRMLEWRFVKGEKRLSNDYLSSLSRKQKELFDKKFEKPTDSPSEKVKLIRAVIAEMKEKGYASRRIRICQGLRIKKEYERIGERVRVHLPFPIECPEQSDIKLLDCSHPHYISEGPQRTVYIETNLCEDEEFFVDYEYTIKLPYVSFDYSKPTTIPEGTEISEEAPHIVFTPLIRETAREICDGETDPLRKAKRIYDFVTGYLRYSYMREYLLIENIPEFALTSTVGDCGVMALLFITLCRAEGIPAFWQSGQSVTPLRVGSHDWATFYIEPYGMLHADLSSGEDAAEKNDPERREFYFGNVCPFRMIANNAFMKEFDPPKKHVRIDPYDNQSGEVEYSDRGLRSGEISTWKKLVSFETL